MISKEQHLIKEIFSPLASGSPDKMKLKDDIAYSKDFKANNLCYNKDLLVENIHFFSNDYAKLIAKKSIRVNVSDLISKGATPRYYMLGIAIPSHVDKKWLYQFAEGLHEEQNSFSLSLIGGDITSINGPLVISISIFGSAGTNNIVRRSGAKVGDDIYVTGYIGDSSLGCIIKKYAPRWGNEITLDNKKYLINSYLLPQIPFPIKDIIGNIATASMDVSDGLLGDMELMCDVSEVSFAIDINKIPLSNAVVEAIKYDASLYSNAITGGDDYQTLFCANSEKSNEIIKFANQAGINITKIGKVVKKVSGSALFNIKNNTPIKFSNMSYSHL